MVSPQFKKLSSNLIWLYLYILMNKYVKTFLGVLIVTIPVLIVLGVVFNNLSKRSFYPDSGEIAVTGLKQPVKLYFDEY